MKIRLVNVISFYEVFKTFWSDLWVFYTKYHAGA